MAPPAPSQASYIPPPPPPQGSYQGGYGAPPAAQPIPNYLVQSILVTLCCCLPLGIVAIVFAAQVNSKLAAGDVNGAREASANAKKFMMLAFWIGIALIIISMLINGAALIPVLREAMANR
jgi:hypothetical protein